MRNLAWNLDAVQHYVRRAKHVRELLLLYPSHTSLQDRLILLVLHLLPKMLQRVHQEATCAACRIENDLAELWIDHIDHELCDGSGRVELASISG